MLFWWAADMVDIKDKVGRELGKRLGKNIAENRKGIGWTQANVAEKLGVDTETISRFERGASLPSLVTLEKLAHALNTTISDLLEEDSVRLHDDQAGIVSAWLSGLKEKDRLFVTEWVKQTCRHLGSKSV